MNKPRQFGDSLAKKVQLRVNVKRKEAFIVLSLNKKEKDPPLEPYCTDVHQAESIVCED